MKTTILAILVLSPFCVGAQQYHPQGGWQPDLPGWHLGNELQSQPEQLTGRPVPDFDEADGTRYIQVLTSLPYDSHIGCIGIAITLPLPGDAAPIKVARVWPGSLAEVAGIQPEWFIISVDGVNAVGMSADRFFSCAFGTVGTLVTLELADPALSQTNRITIKREHVKFPSFLFQRFIDNKPAIFDTPPNYSPGQPVVAAYRSAVAVHVTDRRQLGS